MKGPREILRGAVERIDDSLLPEARSAREQWQRTVMDEAIDAHIAALGPSSLAAAEVSGDSHSDKGWREFTNLNYPEFDLCEPVDEPGGFDVVICEQVLEHVVDPWAAARHLRELTVPGGHVIVSTPFLVKVHEIVPFKMFDYWRFTPRGLRLLLESGGLTVDSVDTWGNSWCVAGNFRRWPAQRRWLPLRDDPELAIQVWAFARNGGAKGETRGGSEQPVEE